MRITELHIYHFKSIREIHLTEIENVLILVGQNSSGKTCILDAIRAVMGNYVIAPEDFNEKRQKIEIEAEIELDEESLKSLHARKIVSGYKRYEKWLLETSCLPGKTDACALRSRRARMGTSGILTGCIKITGISVSSFRRYSIWTVKEISDRYRRRS